MTVYQVRKKYYRKPDPGVWSGRIDHPKDPQTLRLHQAVDAVNILKGTVQDRRVILGFACDTGVKRNEGRPGAAGGPECIRKVLSSMAWHESEERITDLGDIVVSKGDLDGAQYELGRVIADLKLAGKHTVVLGGGHETAFGHFQGLLDFLIETDASPKPGIVNIDAHFDLRSYGELAHSGSPFLQAHELAAQENIDLKYFVYGINRDNNTASLFRKAKELGTRYCSNREVIEQEGASLHSLNEFMKGRSHIYLTICLDAFDASIAPGVSAPAWNGIGLRHALKVIDLVRSSGKMISADVCEMNPAYDPDHRTARTAATLVSELIR